MRTQAVVRVAAVAVALGSLGAGPVPDAAVQEKERGDRLIANGDPTGALEAYKNAVRLAPHFAPALNEYGFLLFKQGKQAEAIDLFQRATQADPSFPQSFFNLGFALRKTQRFAEAAVSYRRYAELKPEDPDGFYGLAEALKGAGDKRSAVTAYESYLARENRPSEQKWIDKAKSSIAQINKELAAQPAPQPAAVAATPAVAVAPAVAPAAVSQPAAVPAPQPTPQAAPQPAVSATAASPAGTTIANPDAARLKIADGNRLFAQRNFKDAAIQYQDAVNADPGNVEALFQLGLAYAQLGYFDQAVARWDKVAQISGDPKWRTAAEQNAVKARAKLAQLNPRPQPSPAAAARPAAAPVAAPTAQNADAAARQKYEEGVRLIYEKRYGEAIAALNQAVTHKVNFPEAFIARGSAQIGLRQYAGAALDYDYALKLNGRLAAPLFGLGEAYRAMQRRSEAAHYFQKYAESRSDDAQPDLQREAEQRARELRQ